MFELVDAYSQNSAVIRVIGIGGGGGNAVEHMLASNVEGVEFVCANTDAQVLKNSSVRTVLQLGSNVTKGLGAGANPEIGRQSALEDRDRIVDLLDGADMIFITAGMGGGTGTGASPIVAQLAKEMGILTVAVVTKPFPFELKRRMKIAEEGIAELITRPGMINVDFADVRTVMSEKGRAMMGSGKATGEDRASRAAETAIACPLLEDVNLKGARGILVNVSAGPDLGMDEFAAVGEAVGEFASDNALVVIGTALDENLKDELRVTVVATGLGEKAARADRDVRLVVPNPSGEVDYKRFDTPTVMRKQPPKAQAAVAALEDDDDYLDIPAFLRRQAD